MKKLLNPRLNTKEVTVLDDDSSDEKIEYTKGNCKGKKTFKDGRRVCPRLETQN